MRTIVQVLGLMTSLTLLVTLQVQAQSSFTDDVVIGAPATEDVDRELMPLKNTLSKAQFDSLSGVGTVARARLNQQFNTRLARIHETCSLTEEQRQKLQLAARGDTARILGEAARLQTKYVDRPLPADGIAPIQTEIIRELMIPLARPFGENSMFFKVLRRSLTNEQFMQYQALDRIERRDAIRYAISPFFRGAHELSLAQERLIFDQIQSKYPTWHPQMVPAAYSHYVGVLVAAELSDELQPILNNVQWEHLQTHIPAGRRLEPRLRSFGLWPIQDESAPASKE